MGFRLVQVSDADPESNPGIGVSRGVYAGGTDTVKTTYDFRGLDLSGNRTLAKMRAFDFVVTVALGTLLSTSIVTRSTPLCTTSRSTTRCCRGGHPLQRR